ncbi:hypothetical protein BB427_07940 [Pseudoalteromonas sp. BMB]|uniref:hypothetical protein n=1 Tax=Pseudoalteromonas sp. BMB TaxID=1874619 RepID=UPI00083DCE1D|nr:hypothetical protein [Pseudoalteromonas sp. BMB]ODB43158.1 hypothetical protein BB427_07940 [Pseudoalteromonas sp. BMB]
MKFIPFRNLRCPGLETALWYCRLLFLTGVALIVLGVIKEGIAIYHWLVAMVENGDAPIKAAYLYDLDLLSHPNFHLIIVGVVKIYFSCGLAIKLKTMSHEQALQK